jgi:hypothetical protein
MKSSQSKSTLPTGSQTTQPQLSEQPPVPDDRYPGTFFRIPGVPLPGKTTWSLVK